METKNYPVKEKCFLIGQSYNCFRPGVPSEIKGIKYVTPGPTFVPRYCYEVEHTDGVKDFIPLTEVENGNYKFCISMDFFKNDL